VPKRKREISPLRKYKNRKITERIMEEHSRESEARAELVIAIGDVMKERCPKAYKELEFYFEHPNSLTVTMDWETLAAIMMLSPTDMHDKGEF
jgi:transposase